MICLLTFTNFEGHLWEPLTLVHHNEEQMPFQIVNIAGLNAVFNLLPYLGLQLYLGSHCTVDHAIEIPAWAIMIFLAIASLLAVFTVPPRPRLNNP